MAKKRANGEGSIYKRKDGKWCSAITLDNDLITGKPRRKYIYGKTRQDVSKKLIELQGSIQAGSYKEPSDLTLGAWLDYWLFNSKKIKLRAKTFEAYEYMIRVHIKTHLGSENLMKLTKEKIQNFYNFLHMHGRADGKGGLSSKTIINIHKMLHDALQQAIDDGKALKNATKGTSLPEKKQKEISIFTRDEQIKFLEIAKQDRLGTAFILDLGSGLRLGELLGLSWQHVDIINGIIKVRRSLVRVKIFDENKKSYSVLDVQDVKTSASIRNVPIPPNILHLIKVHKLNQEKEKKLLGYKFRDNNLVFCTEIGTFIEPSNFDRKFKQLLKKAGLKKTNIHSLRHTYASRLLEASVHPKVVQELLGHSSIELTLDTYSHVLPEVKQSSTVKINNLFSINAAHEDKIVTLDKTKLDNLFEIG